MSASESPPVLIVAGPPGAGKTTAANLLAARWDRAVHLESDAFFHSIRSGFIEPWKPESHEQNRTVMRVVAGAAGGYASAGYFTIVEGIVIPGWFFEPLRDSLSAAGHRVAYVVLRAPLAVCAERARSRERMPLGDLNVAETLWQSFSDLGVLEQYVLDQGDMTPAEVVDELAGRLANGHLMV